MPEKHGKHFGQALLGLVILIGGIVFAAGIAIALFTAAFVDSTAGYQSSEQAEAAAIAGVEDALLQIARNSQFSSSGYALGVGSSTATIVVNQNTPSSGFDTIVSQSTISLRTRKLQVVVSLNGTTGQTNVVSWTEIQ